MSHLKKLRITRRIIQRRPRRQRADTAERRREKLIAQVEEQLELAQLAIAGKPLRLERKRGRMVKEVAPRLWWTLDEDGGVAVQIYYNRVPLKLRGEASTIEVPSLKKLPGTFRTIAKAIKAGELDRAISSVVDYGKDGV